MTVAEASAYLKVGRATLYRWAREGRLQLHKLGARTTRVRRSELDRILEPNDNSDAWTALSEQSFAEDWDSEEDAVYDNWRELYGVRTR
jgi:excisionase family DNA binding protein